MWHAAIILVFHSIVHVSGSGNFTDKYSSTTATFSHNTITSSIIKKNLYHRHKPQTLSNIYHLNSHNQTHNQSESHDPSRNFSSTQSTPKIGSEQPKINFTIIYLMVPLSILVGYLLLLCIKQPTVFDNRYKPLKRR